MNFRKTLAWLSRRSQIVAAVIVVYVAPAAAQLPPVFAECANVRAPDLAIASCSRIIHSGRTSQHNLMLTYFNRGTAWGIKGDTDRAISDLTEAIRIESGYAPAYHNRGLSLARQGKFERAKADFDQAIRLNPGYYQAYGNRGNIYLRECDGARARADFDRAVALDSNFAPGYVGRGATFLNAGDTDRAIADAETAMRIDSGFAPAYAMRAAAHARMRQFDRAIVDIDRALSLNARIASAYNTRGNVYIAKNELDRAVADFNSAIQIDPNYAAAYTSRGLASRLKGDINRAIADYGRAIDLTPLCARPFNNRAYAYALRGELKRALSDANRAVALDPNLALAYGTRGSIYLKMEDANAAIKDLTEAIRRDSTIAEAYTERGLAFERLGNRDRAKADFEASLARPLYSPASQWVHDTARKHLDQIVERRPVAVSETQTTRPAKPNTSPPAPPVANSRSVVPAKSIRDMLAVCNKEAAGTFTLPGANGDIKLNSCYRGADHLNCAIDALVAEAKSISQSYKEIADPRYTDANNIDAICRIDPGVLADYLKRATSFDSRWDVLSAEYAKLADCSNSVEESIRNVVLDVPRGGDIVKSMLEKIRGSVRRVSESQKQVLDLSVEIEASRKALTMFQKIRNGGMCPKKSN